MVGKGNQRVAKGERVFEGRGGEEGVETVVLEGLLRVVHLAMCREIEERGEFLLSVADR